jgi:uncharacterized protein YndB with AHSA1/START domain
MSVTSVHKDPERLTMTITSEFHAPVARLWQVWEDPRQLERWWGPPTYPATFVDHDLTPGATARYFMTGPEGDEFHGWWRIVSVEPPHHLEFEDGFADDNGRPNPNMPTTVTRVALTSPSATKSTMVITTQFPSLEAMEQMAEMGMEVGMTLAIGQIEALLSEATTPGIPA